VLSFMVARVPAAAPPQGVRASRPQPAAVSAAGVTETPPAQTTRRRETRRRRGRDARTPVAVAVARMEIQTADPDVRIIWLTN